MTDGILLAEIAARPRCCARYDTIIIDEAHERSLNIDFLLGYLKQLLPRRPDLKVIITSATIDTERFADALRRADGTPAPIIEVSGRTYPVEVRYRAAAASRTATTATRCRRDRRRGRGARAPTAPGDMLVFLLRRARDPRHRRRAARRCRLRDTEVLPLYARLSAAEQHRVFAAAHRPADRAGDQRRRDLADRARASATSSTRARRASPATAAGPRCSGCRSSRSRRRRRNQRAGPLRPGAPTASASGSTPRRTSLARPEFTEPEILRTNLASVILQMTALGLGDIAAFPFLEPPDARAGAATASSCCDELGALDGRRDARPRLTAIGRRLARLPLDPRLGADGARGGPAGLRCARCWSSPPRCPSRTRASGRPTSRRRPTSCTRGSRDPTRDFAVLPQPVELPARAADRRCPATVPADVPRRVPALPAGPRVAGPALASCARPCQDIGHRPVADGEPAAPDRDPHRRCSPACCRTSGSRDGEQREYLGARGARFAISPGLGAGPEAAASAVMAAELVETSRLLARVTRAIDPAGSSRWPAHLVKRSYCEPQWSKKRGRGRRRREGHAVRRAARRRRACQLRPDRPRVARDLFIRHALVEGEWDDPPPVLARQRAAARRGGRGARGPRPPPRPARRRRGARSPSTTRASPPTWCPAAHFDRWWKTARPRAARPADVPARPARCATAGGVDDERLPRLVVRRSDARPAADYAFEPGARRRRRHRRRAAGAAAPGSHPEELRLAGARPSRGGRHGADAVAAQGAAHAVRPGARTPRAPCCRALDEGRDLPDALGRALTRTSGVPGAQQRVGDLGALPDHLRMTFRVVDEARRGGRRGEGPRVAAGRARARGAAALSRAWRSGLERTGLGTSRRAACRRSVEPTPASTPCTATRRSSTAATHVDLRVLATPTGQQARDASRAYGGCCCSAAASPVQARLWRTEHPPEAGARPHPARPVAYPRCLADASAPRWTRCWRESGLPLRTSGLRRRPAARTCRPACRGRARGVGLLAGGARGGTAGACGLAGTVAEGSGSCGPAMSEPRSTRWCPTGSSRPPASGGCPTCALPARGAGRHRKAPQDTGRDPQPPRSRQVAGERRTAPASRTRPSASPTARGLRWMVEELRVSLFAQGLGTAYPVSSTRILRAVAAPD